LRREEAQRNQELMAVIRVSVNGTEESYKNHFELLSPPKRKKSKTPVVQASPAVEGVFQYNKR